MSDPYVLTKRQITFIQKASAVTSAMFVEAKEIAQRDLGLDPGKASDELLASIVQSLAMTYHASLNDSNMPNP